MKTYIIDLDGTLVDSMHIWEVLAIHYLQSLNKDIKPNLIEDLKTMSLTQAAIYLQKEYGIEKTIKDIQKDFIKQLWKEYEDVSLKAGVIEFLEKCYQEHQDVIIFTANDSLLTQHLCQRLHIDQFIKHIISCQDIGYDKTDSQSYQKVIEKYHLEDCIVIEDAYHALKSAKTAKLKTWAIYDKANQKEWKQICQIANQYFMTFYEMEVIK
ncbi:HAD family phosphatase [Allocoprobacillus halotolerans]|uniref:HAD family phosphatase n=1 Tax=Allocoprobacillus halotolerans TaxID=2944914 RepID=A0ABY5I5J8_9FIRM|nr:HAD family phosphatase [Allocoprobacillus halotolerans]UTY40632.1 HAD family phosphatase [Allocoprobacillus halotolerans]